MVAASMWAMMMGASAANRRDPYSERRNLEERGGREESSHLYIVRLMEG